MRGVLKLIKGLKGFEILIEIFDAHGVEQVQFL